MTSLARDIATHRAMYRDDAHISRLVQRQPPTTLDLNTGQLYSEDPSALGMTLSGPMLKYLGHPEGFGSSFPWAKAFWLLRVECRRRHPQHRSGDRPQWRGALCHQAVKLVIIGAEANQLGPLTPEQAGQVLRIDRIDDILRRAFRFIEDTMDDFRERAERRAREDAGHALTCKCGHGWPRHDNPALLFRCDACDCSRYNADAGRKAA